MNDILELDPVAFVLTCTRSGLQLAAEATSFISIPTIGTGFTTDMHELADLRSLWLQSNGRCQVQFSVERDGTLLQDQRTLEHVAMQIVSHPIWSEMSLLAELDELHYDAVEGEPNLYLTVEHRDKSYALLAPPHMPAAHLSGLHCQLDFIGEMQLVVDEGQLDDVTMREESTLTAGSITLEEHQVDALWGLIDSLLAAVVRELFGVRKKLSHITKRTSKRGPSLVELAPAVWNSTYLQHVAAHAAQIPAITNIISSYSRANKPSLRNKINAMIGDPNQTEYGLSEHLWRAMLQNTKSSRAKILSSEQRASTEANKQAFVEQTEVVAPGLSFAEIAPQKTSSQALDNEISSDISRHYMLSSSVLQDYYIDDRAVSEFDSVNCLPRQTGNTYYHNPTDIEEFGAGRIFSYE